MTETDAGVRVEALKHAQARKTLPELCAEYRRLAVDGDAISAAMTAVKKDIDVMAGKAGVKKILGDGWIVLKVAGRTTRKLKPELLAENGVDLETIEKSTVVSTGSPHFQVRKGDAD